MRNNQDRRSFVERLAVGAAAFGAGGIAAAPDGEAASHRRKSVRYSFRGRFSAPVYQVDPKRGDPYYLITFRQKNDLRLQETGKKGSRAISGAATLDMMLRMSRRGDLKGKPAFRIEDINWRIHRADFDETTGTWTLHASVCSTNRDARPDLAQRAGEDAGAEWYSGMKGSGCGCNACDYCWICGADNSHHCSQAVQYHCLSRRLGIRPDETTAAREESDS